MSFQDRKLHWSVLAFLSAFALILVLVGWFFLIPAAGAMEHADATQRAWLDATSRLLLAVVLFVLAGVLVLSFRLGRFFLPGPTSRRTHTRYVDAWKEAGRRMPLPEDDSPKEPPTENH